jgi:hypothetical protein
VQSDLRILVSVSRLCRYYLRIYRTSMIRFLVAFSNRSRLKGDSLLVEILFEIGSPCSSNSLALLQPDNPCPMLVQ